MNILVVNGSPKGKNSTTLHSVLYMQALHPEHTFTVLHAGQRIRSLEKDFSPARAALLQADLILFCYPVYTFLAPYQLHRFLELVREAHLDFSGKVASQVTTSKHFYDVTAHRFIEENCFDLGLQVIRGYSADMDDLLTEKGREEAAMFFDELLFSYAQKLFCMPPPAPPKEQRCAYQPSLATVPKKPDKRVVLVTNCGEADTGLSAMISDFCHVLPYCCDIVNIRSFSFAGGCLGCFGCATDGTCVYHDGFDRFLRQQIQTADAIVYAFTVEGHFTHSSMKCYDDRQFCNGHRTVTRGIPAAYLIQGDYRFERNLQTVIEARSEVGGNYLCGVATDECDTAQSISTLAKSVDFALCRGMRRPANFYGVGGMKIFRDLIYVMQGLMRADHKFYQENHIYDFPQKQHLTKWKMRLVGGMMAIPSVRRKMRGKMNDYIIAPYRKVVQEAEKAQKKQD